MLLAPHPDVLITMSRKIYEASSLSFINVSFSVQCDKSELELVTHVVVTEHDDEAGTSDIIEVIPVAQVVASYIGLTLELDLDANDAVTTGHRLGNTGR